MALIGVRRFDYMLMLALASTILAQARGQELGGFWSGKGERTHYPQPPTPPYPPKPPPPPPAATSSPPECPSGYPASPDASDTSRRQLLFPPPPPPPWNGSIILINTLADTVNGVMDGGLPLVPCYDISKLKQQWRHSCYFGNSYRKPSIRGAERWCLS